MRRREFLALTLPSMLVMFGFMLVPLYRTVEWSFEKVSYGRAGTFVGLQNYLAALTEPRFGRAVLFTVGLTAVVTVVTVCLGYLIANLVNGLGRLRPLVLGIMLISYVIPHVVGAVSFSWLFDSNFGGVANFLLGQVTGGDVLWFTDLWPNRLIIALNVIWSMLPFVMLMILAGLQGVPSETLEAAQIDGAGTIMRHRHVIIPSIRGVLGFAVLISTMDVLRTFDNLVPLAPQAVGLGNESIMLYIYNVAFREGAEDLGLGSAISVLTIIIILVLLYPSIRSILKEAKEA
ncbi:carbohydrate ABC transporter permease [Auraticoccus monumenti]|uniref:Carbohydrate ABC transporter membrane protein 1, CUT1 family n=1 Tax=Auraticoccus monumenti TaxID=675864 RepID=A0A1G6S6T1_9ACTN|nr:sugar ABC transporter permease [Auraticoccus monumenti]SDD12391.1 carbohydrate ABC transporter membrane protein 1, CUT1 family [Auraticoccus monumenti]